MTCRGDVAEDFQAFANSSRKCFASA